MSLSDGPGKLRTNMTRSISSGIDHVLVATPDLESTRAEFESLGFQVTPGAKHERFGTANYLCILDDSYIELIGIENHDAPDRTSLDVLEPCIANGGGLPMMALATDDAIASHRALRSIGIPAGEPLQWSRRADTPDGQRTASFTTLFAETEIIPELVAFFCEHHTPGFVRHPAWRVHPNTASHLIGVSLTTRRSMDAVRAQMELVAHSVASGQDHQGVRATLGPHYLHYQPTQGSGLSMIVIGVRSLEPVLCVGQWINQHTRAVALSSVRGTTIVFSSDGKFCDTAGNAKAF